MSNSSGEKVKIAQLSMLFGGISLAPQTHSASNDWLTRAHGSWRLAS
jgi:hypothetical protein